MYSYGSGRKLYRFYRCPHHRKDVPLLADYNVPALLTKAPNLISHISDSAAAELFRLVYKRIVFNPANGEFSAECHHL